MESLSIEQEIEALSTENETALLHAKRIIEEKIQKNITSIKENFAELVSLVFEDKIIEKEYDGAFIRYMAMAGDTLNSICETLETPENKVHLLTIGDINPPSFAKDELNKISQRANQIKAILDQKFGHGYDKSAKGMELARRRVLTYFDGYYGFSEVEGLLEKLITQSTIIGGGMRGLDDTLSAIISSSNENNSDKNLRIISPDNSFGTWESLQQIRSHKGKRAKLHQIETSQNKGLHLSAQEVQKFYLDHSDDHSLFEDYWYITPVGNPSGTKIENDQFYETCLEALKFNKNVKFIFDCTYIRVLGKERARKLMEKIIQTPEIVERALFIDSFSKTHGFCRERIALLFSPNTDLYGTIQNLIVKVSAGNGFYKEALALAISEPSPEREEILTKLHNFWNKETQALYHFLITSQNFPHLFHKNQDHIDLHSFKKPSAPYLFLRLKETVSALDVMKETKCLGVQTKMGTGNYLRLALGCLESSTFSLQA